jgi:hypothetical protein
MLTRAFCFGEERQQMTELHPIARSRNMSLVSSLSACVSDLPSMIKANDSLPDALMSFFPSFICCTTLSFDACHIRNIQRYYCKLKKKVQTMVLKASP